MSHNPDMREAREKWTNYFENIYLGLFPNKRIDNRSATNLQGKWVNMRNVHKSHFLLPSEGVGRLASCILSGSRQGYSMRMLC